MPKKQNDKEKEFRRIINKYLKGLATPVELDFLKQYYKEFENNPNLLDDISEEEVREIGEGIKNKIYKDVIAFERKNARVIYLKRYLPRAAAVFIIFLISIFFYLLFQTGNQEKFIATETHHVEEKHIILPGGNKAILTLSDNKQIILGSSDSEEVRTDGGVKIVILQDGSLSYQSLPKKNQSSTVQYNTLSTPRGGQYYLQLADGSKVWLNSESSLTYPTSFVGNERRVEMSGEVYFEIAHNAAKPFIVTKDDLKIEVLGTHFNMNTYQDDNNQKVTLMEGAVKVVLGNKSEILKPGEQAVIQTAKSTLQASDNVNLSEIMAWKNGEFYFEKSDIQTVMNQISRWYDVDVEYQGRVDSKFGGTIKKNVDVLSVLEMLELTGKVQFKIEGKKVIVMPRLSK